MDIEAKKKKKRLFSNVIMFCTTFDSEVLKHFIWIEPFCF